MLALRVFQSCLSTLAVNFLFRERLRPSRPHVFLLPGICEKKTMGRGFERLVTSELTSAQCPRASPSPQRERAFARPLPSTWSASLRCERHDLVQCEWWRNRWHEELICIMTKAVNELGLEWSLLRSHLTAGWTSVFSRDAIKPPANARPPSSPKFLRAHDIVARPPFVSHPYFYFSCSHICW